MLRTTPFIFLFAIFCNIVFSQTQTCVSGNCQDGYGTMDFSNGATYTGNFKNGQYEGQGTSKWTEGTTRYTYTGQYVNSYFKGKGTLTWDGNKYVGEFNNDIRTGYGVLTWSSGEKYEGNFVDGKLNGQGTMTYTDGSRYTGNFDNDSKSGQGTYVFTNGSKYVGQWKNDKRHGRGTLYFPDGMEQWEGNWVNDNATDQYDPDYAAKQAKSNNSYNSNTSSNSYTSNSSNSQQQSKKIPCGFGGRWKTNWDGTEAILNMTMSSEKNMTGNYNYYSDGKTVYGTVSGTITDVMQGGNDAKITMTGTWSEGSISGTFEFSTVCSKTAFSGSWANNNGRESGMWVGSKE
jgi:hypothetical protein